MMTMVCVVPLFVFSMTSCADVDEEPGSEAGADSARRRRPTQRNRTLKSPSRENLTPKMVMHPKTRLAPQRYWILRWPEIWRSSVTMMMKAT